MSLAETLLELVESQIASKRMILPTLPDVAMKIGDIARRGDADAALLAREIAKDPAFTARLLRTANSAAMQGRGKKVESLQMAVARLGFDLSCALVKRMAIEQVFQAKAPVLRIIMQKTWARSLEVAALSQVLAAHRTDLQADTAMLAGLTHLVGVLPIVRIVDQKPQLASTDRELENAIAAVHPRIARLVLQEWNFPEALLDVPCRAFDLARTHDGPADLADVVTVSMLQIPEDGTTLLPGVDRTAVAAFAKLGFRPEEHVLEIPEVEEAYGTGLELLS